MIQQVAIAAVRDSASLTFTFEILSTTIASSVTNLTQVRLRGWKMAFTKLVCPCIHCHRKFITLYL